MVGTEKACVHVADVHDRMPVVLQCDDWGRWVEGPPEDARALCPPCPAALRLSDGLMAASLALNFNDRYMDPFSIISAPSLPAQTRSRIAALGCAPFSSAWHLSLERGRPLLAPGAQQTAE
jgi:hypothetical protein